MEPDVLPPRALTKRYDDALLYASNAHRTQFRKNGRAPYLSHLIRVSGLTFDYGATEDVAIAALLHDVVEDCGGLKRSEEVRVLFGDRVADIVLATSDSLAESPDKKEPWRTRKERYLERLKSCSEEAALVIGCDKLDNVCSLTRTLEMSDAAAASSFLRKFKANRQDNFWYYETSAGILRDRGCLVNVELFRAIDVLKSIWKEEGKD